MRSMPSRLASLFFCLLAFALVAPLSGCKPPKYPNCKKDKHCKVDLGEKCVDGKCQNCTTDEDCKAKGPNGEDFTCFEFRCTDPTQIPDGAGDGGPGSLGTPCTQTIDCTGGLVCTAGKCSNCTDDIECDGVTCDLSTGTCGGAGGGGQCSTDDECAIDEICDLGTCIFPGDIPAKENPCGITSVFFDFNSPQIKDEAAESLRSIAECIQQQGAASIALEAHADPRGTEEYNILLTDRRGQSVKKFLVDLGVPGEGMTVISKGSLEATGSDEASFQQDRRVDFIFQ